MTVPGSASVEVPAAARCDYCGGPVAAPGDRFCCYGCRVLGQDLPAGVRRPDAPSDAAGSWFRIGFGTVMAAQAMVVGLAVNLSPPAGPVRWALHGVLILSAVASLAVLGPGLLQTAWQCACRRRLAVELLFLSGVLGALGASLIATFSGTGAVYYEVVSVLLTVYAASRLLTARARARALGETDRLRAGFARARVDAGDAGFREAVPVEAVEAGDVVVVFPGEGIPIDGSVVHGEAFVRETPLTGEPHPVTRRPGDPVWAGSFSEDGELRIRASTPGRSRRLDELLRRLDAARDSLDGTAAQTQADRLAAWFLPLVLGVALGTLAFWSVRAGWTVGLFHALSVLLVACPCALGLATPLALWSGLAVLGSRGVVVRRAAVLERLARVSEVWFDKTGTLTDRRAVLVDLVLRDAAPVDRSTLRAVLATVQARSSHPLAAAFADAAGDVDVEVTHFQSTPARGVGAWIRLADGREHGVRIGIREWAAPDGGESGLADRVRSVPGDQEVWVGLDGRAVALAVVREQARDSAAEALAACGRLGCPGGILTGDRVERARDLVGSDPRWRVDGGLAPEAKARHLETRRAAGAVVAFVGDGINDGPALRAADVGIALASGSSLAGATADVVLLSDDLREVPGMVALARQVDRSIRGNLGFAATYNLLGMGLAAAGQLHPVVAALLMMGSSAVVSWRSVRGASAAACGVPVGEGGSGPAAGRRWGWIAACLGLQISLLGWLGRLGPAGWAWAAVGQGLLLGAVWLVRRGRLPAILGTWPGMTLAMLGPGNLLMLVGWWIDAGCGPVMRDGVCLCCSGHHYFEPGWRIPWMYVGMLAGGLPAMAAFLPGVRSGWDRIRFLSLAAVGMVGGMGLGAGWALRWAGPGHPGQFLVAYAGMTLGMTAGMVFLCALGEILGRRKVGG